MPKAMIDNVAGHRSKYDHLVAHVAATDVGMLYVGASDPVLTGYHELEFIRSRATVKGASVVDIGCGIGRLTRHLAHEEIKTYLGTDVVPEIMQEARNTASNDPRFSFQIAESCTIPAPDQSVDIVTAFSVITHLIDEEVFEYFLEARRVVSSDGVVIFSFLDFMNDGHQETFFKHASQHRHGQGDMLKFTTQDVLYLFGRRAGFKSIQFVSGQASIPTSGVHSALLDVSKAAPAFQMGQSVCVMRTR